MVKIKHSSCDLGYVYKGTLERIHLEPVLLRIGFPFTLCLGTVLYRRSTLL